MMRLAPAVAVLVAGVLAAPAGAQIFRCRHADGSLTFTSDPSSCGGSARVHQPDREIQVIDGVADPPAAADPEALPAPPPPAPTGADAQAAMWSRKKTSAEQELAQLERTVEEFRQLVAWCNRGGELVVEDAAGLDQQGSCDEVRGTHEKMGPRIEHLREYLERGLADECRRAGCLPGWIR